MNKYFFAKLVQTTVNDRAEHCLVLSPHLRYTGEKYHLEGPRFKAGSTVEKVIKPGYWLQHKMKAGIGPLGQLNCLCLNQIFSTGKQHVIRLIFRGGPMLSLPLLFRISSSIHMITKAVCHPSLILLNFSFLRRTRLQIIIENGYYEANPFLA